MDITEIITGILLVVLIAMIAVKMQIIASDGDRSYIDEVDARDEELRGNNDITQENPTVQKG
jgi:hypothetical protein